MIADGRERSCGLRSRVISASRAGYLRQSQTTSPNRRADGD